VVTSLYTRLVGVAHLQADRRSIVDLVIEANRAGTSNPVVVVPTRSAGRQLMHLLESVAGIRFAGPSDPRETGHAAAGPAPDNAHSLAVRADVVTRDELYDR